uniref:Hydrogenase maturation protease n=1 Tax=Magnetococcus massalia (strain MO-1) TaxID=451514 RepID=A0A1S7LCG1_MAGMO|nr:conserved protein of unknown function [Candidatus Magnetococcus massalia]
MKCEPLTQLPPGLAQPLGVVGLGSPLMGDDGVGPALVTQLQERLPSIWAHELGSDLLGLHNLAPLPPTLILADAAHTGQLFFGTFALYPHQTLIDQQYGTLRSAHQLPALDALALLQQCYPELFHGVALYWLLFEVGDITMGEGLSPELARAVSRAVALLQRHQG